MTDHELLELIAEKVVSLESNFSGMKSEMTVMKSDINDMKSDITELKSDMTEVKSDIAELKSDMTEVKSDITELKSDMTEVKSDIKSLQQKQEIIMEQTAGLSEFHAPASKTLSNHQDSIEFLKARQTALEEEVFRLKKKIS